MGRQEEPIVNGSSVEDFMARENVDPVDLVQSILLSNALQLIGQAVLSLIFTATPRDRGTFIVRLRGWARGLPAGEKRDRASETIDTFVRMVSEARAFERTRN